MNLMKLAVKKGPKNVKNHFSFFLIPFNSISCPLFIALVFRPKRPLVGQIIVILLITIYINFIWFILFIFNWFFLDFILIFNKNRIKIKYNSFYFINMNIWYIYNEIIHVYKMNNDDDDIISQLSLRYE